MGPDLRRGDVCGSAPAFTTSVIPPEGGTQDTMLQGNAVLLALALHNNPERTHAER